ncbi:MAG: hypothetical protein ACRC0X_08910 [Brevinema sp.]
MKNIYTLLFVFLISTAGYSQTDKQLPPPYISIYTIFGGVSTLPNSGSPHHTLPTMWLILDGRIPIGYNKIYLYAQFRSSFFLGESKIPISVILPVIHMESTKLGFLLGLGGILHDWRTNDIGWHVALNGGIVFEGAVNNPFISLQSTTERFFNIGVEINTIFYYNFKKHIGLNLGFHLGYLYSPFSGDPFYLGLQNQVTFFHMMNYGLSFGIQF